MGGVALASACGVKVSVPPIVPSGRRLVAVMRGLVPPWALAWRVMTSRRSLHSPAVATMCTWLTQPRARTAAAMSSMVESLTTTTGAALSMLGARVMMSGWQSSMSTVLRPVAERLAGSMNMRLALSGASCVRCCVASALTMCACGSASSGMLCAASWQSCGCCST